MGITMFLSRGIGISVVVAALLLSACGGGGVEPPPRPPAQPTVAPPVAVATPAQAPVVVAPTPTAAPVTQATPRPPQAATPTQGPKFGGSIAVALPRGFTSLDPLWSGSSWDLQFFNHVLETLVTFDANTQAVPLLAESWETPDAKTYIFHLRKGVKFQDGTDLNAAAVKASIDRVADPNLKNTQLTYIEAVSGVSVIDDYTVKLSLKAPFAQLLVGLYERSGRISSPKAIEGTSRSNPAKPVGSGPYRLTDFKTDSSYTLERWSGYRDPQVPYLTKISYLVIPDASTAVASLRTGTVDVLWEVAYPSVDTLKKDRGLYLLQVEAIRRGKISMNVNKGPLADRNLRLAMASAINPENVIKVANFGIGTPGRKTIIFPWRWDYDPSVPEFKQDVNLAKQYLAAAGKPEGFTFNIMHFADDAVLDVIRADLAKVGIAMKSDKIDIGTYASRNSRVEYEASYATAGPQLSFHPAMFYRKFVWSKGGFPAGGFADPRADELIAQLEAETNLEKAKGLSRQIDRIFNEVLPQIQVFDGPRIVAARNRVRGVVNHPDETVHLEQAWIGE